MKFKLLTACLAITLANTIFAQDSSLLNKQNYPAYRGGTPLITIKGEEISRFPSSNFLDAVNGLFPAVFSQEPNPNNFLFIVNGNILFDINAISLFDIEEISFTRAPLDGSLWPYSKSGIFYIKTKTPASGFNISFNTQYNVVTNRDKKLFEPGGSLIEQSTKLNNEAGHYQSHHLAIGASGKKASLYISSQLEHFREPELNQQSVSKSSLGETYNSEGSTKSKVLNTKNFIDFNYRFSPKVSGGISGLYFHGKSTMDSTGSINSSQFISSGHISYKTPILYYYGRAYLSINLLTSLKNTASFEYRYDHFDQQLNATSSYLYTGSNQQNLSLTRNAEPHQKGYIIRNNLEYTPEMKGKFKTAFAAVFNYIRDDMESDKSSSFYNGMIPGNFSFSKFRYKQKTLTLNPLMNFSYADKITGYVGFPFMLNTHAKTNNASTHINNDPYAGMIFNFKNIFGLGNSVSTLDLGLHYGNLTRNSSTNYWLPQVNDAYNFNPGTHFTGTYSYAIQPPKLEVLNNKSFSVALNSGWLSNRLLAGLEWSQLRYEEIFLANISIVPTPVAYYLMGRVQENRFSFYTEARIINNKSFQWTTRLNLLIPKTKYNVNANSYSFVERQYDLQSGWQNQFRAGKFFGQINSLMGLNRKEINHTFVLTGVPNKASEFAINYIMAGYDIPGTGISFIKTLDVYIHARNLAASKETKNFYEFDSYMGAGLNVGF